MISAFQNIFKIPELRNRIVFTLLMIVVIRFGTAITLPGVEPSEVERFIAERLKADEATTGGAAVASLLNVFSGGALTNCAIFALGVMPYISASIMMQLLTAVVPRLSKLAREEGGRSKINQYTRLVTIGLAVVQGYLLVKSLADPSINPVFKDFNGPGGPLVLVPNPDWVFYLSATTSIVAGTMLLMWMGEQITERGIGNGVSLIIGVNIIHNFPSALVQIWNKYVQPAITDKNVSALSPAIMVMLLVFMAIVIAGIIAITQAQRRIPIQYAKRMVGRKVLGGQKQYMPLKVNYAGVMPIIFAQAIITFPVFLGPLFPKAGWLQTALYHLGDPRAFAHYVIMALMIFFFSYFWVATMFQPGQISEELKKNGGYIPGVRPGKPTADFLDFSMSRLTFAGSIFLTLIAVLPVVISLQLEVPPTAAQFFGGTSILILVGVLLDIMRQMETHLLQRHYDGFLRRGKIRGRYDRTRAITAGNMANSTVMMWLYILAAALLIIGAASLLVNK